MQTVDELLSYAMPALKKFPIMVYYCDGRFGYTKQGSEDAKQYAKWSDDYQRGTLRKNGKPCEIIGFYDISMGYGNAHEAIKRDAWAGIMYLVKRGMNNEHTKTINF